MTFPEAMAAVLAGAAVRRDEWGKRRAVKLMVEPWNGETERLLLFDLSGKGDVPPFPYSMTGADVRGDDWQLIEE